MFRFSRENITTATKLAQDFKNTRVAVDEKGYLILFVNNTPVMALVSMPVFEASMSLYERQENETIALEVEKAKTLNVYQKFDLNAYKEMLDKKKEEQSMIEA